ncbi:MAG TPA: hypothetical protein VGK10_01075 [Prolixibacteraceae bacterium]|jgi:hypothetical protein
MKSRIAGVFSFIMAIFMVGLVILNCLLLFHVRLFDEKYEYLALFIRLLIFGLILIFPISAILYIYWTKFGKREDIELIKLERENKLLRRQIVKIDLKKDRETVSKDRCRQEEC